MAKIIIADENYPFARLIANQLRFKGYEVKVIANNEIVLDQLDLEHYDILIMELLLHGQDGLNLLRTIRSSHFSYLRVIIVTHRTSYVEQLRVAEFDAQFLCKPVDLSELLDIVKKLLPEENIVRNFRIYDSCKQEHTEDQLL